MKNITYGYANEGAGHTYTGAIRVDKLKDKYPNFEVGLKCILMVNPYLLVCSYIK